MILILIGLGVYYFNYNKISADIPEKVLPAQIIKFSDEEKSIYYEMFDKNKILDGSESDAKEILDKIDISFSKNKPYFQDLANLEDVKDDKILKAVYLMNFVSFSHPYGSHNKGDGSSSIKNLIWNIEESDCETNTELLAMLLEKKGYENRTVSVDDGYHGFNEVKLNGEWQILDATSNLWFDKSAENLISGRTGRVRKFFLKDLDIERSNASTSDFDLTYLRIQMASLGTDFIPQKISYNFVDFSKWSY